VKRRNFGLADLFGVDFEGRSEDRMQNAYLRCEHDATSHHPLLRGLEDAPRIIHGVSRIEITPREKFGLMPLTLIPSYPDLPMEKVFPRGTEDRYRAGVFAGIWQWPGCVFSRGTSTAHFGRCSCVDHFKLLRNSVEWATNEAPVIEVTGPGVLDVTVWQQKNSMTVHLV